MKRTIQQALRRLRKVQDDIFNGKCDTTGALVEITINSPTPQYNAFYINVNVLRYNPRGSHFFDCLMRSLHNDTTQEEVDALLAEISKFLNYPV